MAKWILYIIMPLIFMLYFSSAGFSSTKSTSIYSIQVGTFLQKENADKILAQLKSKGYEPYIYRSYNSKRQNLYVVRVGDYHKFYQAASAAEQFKKLENIPVLVTKSDSITPIQTKRISQQIISPKELAKIDGRAGTIIHADELAKIDGQTATIMEPNELGTIDGQTGTIISQDDLSSIDGQTGSVMPSEELATVDGQTGTVMPSKELGTVDGQTGSVMPSEELATVDGQTGTVMPSKELGTVDGQTGTVIPRGDLGTMDGQAAGSDFSEDKSEPSVSPPGSSVGPSSGDSFGDMFVEDPNAKTIDSNAAKQLRERIQQLEEKINALREEADVRKILEITEEEQEQEEDQILSATGRDYTMATKGSVGLDYSLGYSFNSPDVLTYLDTYPKVEHKNQHTLTNSLSVTYAVRDNISLGVSVPFIYKYDNMGTGNSKDVTDLGDISLNFRIQPLKAGGKLPPFILSFGYNILTGRSPYKINPAVDMSTGSGSSRLTASLSMSHKLDPIVVFGGMNYGHGFKVDDLDQKYTGTLKAVEPGQNIGMNAGIGYALSYKLTLNLSFSYSYSFGRVNIYNFGERPGAESAGANFSLGTGWRLSPKRSLNVSLSKGLSRDSSDFSINISLPFNL